MSKYLVIIEAPGKVHKFQTILSKDYEIVASKGHVFDLPEKKFSIDMKTFDATFEVSDDKEDVIKNIVSKAKKSTTVYIMTDGDREGTGIGWNIYEHLVKNGVSKSDIKRAKAYAITKKDIEEAIVNATDIEDEKDLYNAFLSRRILDRICGYKCSFPVQQATGGKSAGRTQSAGLKILADRENEIKTFVPVVYWPVDAELLSPKNEKILATIKTPKPLDISTQEEADKIIAVLKKGPIKVSKYDISNASTKPYAPFTTSSLQQTASSFLGFSPDRTMKAAQHLYEGGFITYHRTDSTNMIVPFVDSVRDHIKASYPTKYLSASVNVFKTQTKNAQEAHEAIRPTDVSVTDVAGAGADETKLYDMIWKRAVATQMSPAEYERRSAEFSCDKYVLSATGSKETFDGFRKVWTYGGSDDKYLAEVKVGDTVVGIDFKTEKKETKPPARYSEASFVKELESKGIGRPSTYASIVKTLKDRLYIEAGGGKSITVTDLGIKVIAFMDKVKFCFIDCNFTSDMEEKLDDISNGKLEKTKLLSDYWVRLKQDLENAKAVKQSDSLTDFDCPLCKNKLAKKHSKFGSFYSCSDYPDCKYTAKVGPAPDFLPVEKVKAEVKESTHKCPNCGELLIIRDGKKNQYLGCRNWQEEGCKGFYGLDGVKYAPFKKKSFKNFKKFKKKTKTEDAD